MLFRNCSYAIDENLKNYLKKINDNYMDKYKMDKYKTKTDKYKYDNLIKDELNNDKSESESDSLENVRSRSRTRDRDLIIKSNYASSLLFFLMGISFFSGYQFRGFINITKLK